MEWLKTLLPVIQAGLSAYASGKFIKTTSQNAKSIAVQSGFLAFGSITFFIFFAAAIVMFFVDLGNQFEAHDGIHFSGMMLSAIYLILFALICFGICFGVAKYLSLRKQKQNEKEQIKADPYASLVLFGEEVLKQLMVQLNKQDSGSEEQKRS